MTGSIIIIPVNRTIYQLFMSCLVP
jgi:hypothetical protein